MGHIHAEIELINTYDIESARRYLIGEEEVKRMFVNMMVDTGAALVCINENIQEILQIPYIGKRRGETADGRVIECPVVGSLTLRFKNRDTLCRAMVLPGDSEPLLGVIAMEDMDVIINPLCQELIVNPASPDMAIGNLKGMPSSRRNVEFPHRGFNGI